MASMGIVDVNPPVYKQEIKDTSYVYISKKVDHFNNKKWQASNNDPRPQLPFGLFEENHQDNCAIFGWYEYCRVIIRTNTAQFMQKNQETLPFKLFISKQVTAKIQRSIEGKCDNDLFSLHHYIDIGTTLQINDRAINQFSFFYGDEDKKKEHKLCIFNYDLHLKGSHNHALYGIVVPNEDDSNSWKLDNILSAYHIQRIYKIKEHELPQSSRRTSYFQTRATTKPMINSELINDTNWYNTPHDPGFNNAQLARIKLKICTNRWVESCIKSIQNQDLPVLPIIVRDDTTTNHWIEWIKIIYIKSYDAFSGIQFGYNRKDLLLIGAWLRVEGECKLPTDLKDLVMGFYGALRVKSICVDPTYVYCAHRAIGLKTSITLHEMNKYNKKWVTSIEICDISSKLKPMAQRYRFELNVVKQCFNDHDIDYLYLQNHTRADFAALLRSYNIKVGTAIKIYGALCKDVVNVGNERIFTHDQHISILRHILG